MFYGPRNAKPRSVYDGRNHKSLLSVPAAQPRTLLIRSFTKSFAMPGRRVAFVAGPPPLIDALTKASEWSMLHGAYVNQAAATAVLRGPRDWIAGIAAEFQQARDLLCARIAQFGAITAVTPGGGPFVFLNVSRLRAGAADVAQILLEEFGIPTTSGDFLHGPQHLRLAFGAGLDVLSEVADRLARAVELIGVRANGGSEIQCRNARGPE